MSNKGEYEDNHDKPPFSSFSLSLLTFWYRECFIALYNLTPNSARNLMNEDTDSGLATVEIPLGGSVKNTTTDREEMK